MAFLNNIAFIEALSSINDLALPIIFQDEYGTQCPPTHVDTSLEGLVEVNIDNVNAPLTAELLLDALSKDKVIRGENYITAWDDDASRLQLKRIEVASSQIVVHICQAKRANK